MNTNYIQIKNFLDFYGEHDEEELVAFYECDERETLVVPIIKVRNDMRYKALLESVIASWGYDEFNGTRILCIYYFRNEE